MDQESEEWHQATEKKTRCQGLYGALYLFIHFLFHSMCISYFSLFKGLCKPDHLYENINDAVQRLSKIACLASLNIHFTVYKALLQNNDLWLGNFFNGLKPDISPFFDEVKLTERHIQPRSEFSDLMQRYGIGFIDASNMHNILTYHKGLYLTNFANNIQMNAEMYVKRLFRLYYLRLDQQPDAEDKRQAIDHTIRFLFNANSQTEANEELSVFFEDTTEYSIEIRRGCLSGATKTDGYGWCVFLFFSQNFKKNIQILCNVSHIFTYFRTTFVVPFIKIQMLIDQHNHSEDVECRIDNFAIIPQHGFGRVSVTLDKCALIELFNRSAVHGHGMQQTTDGKIVWDRCFDLTQLRKTTREQFSGLARTDGMKIGFVIDKPVGEIGFEEGDSFGFDSDDYDENEFENTVVNEEDFDYRQLFGGIDIEVARIREFKRFIGIDWGCIYPIAYACIDRNDGNNKETLGYLTADEYYSAVKYDAFIKNLNQITGPFKREEKKDQERVKNQFGLLPSNKSTQYQIYVNHKLRMFASGMETWLAMGIARLQFKQYQLKEGILQEICDWLSQSQPTLIRAGPNVIKRNSIIKGHRRFPINDLMQKMRQDQNIHLVIDDEYMTTKTCSLCFRPITFEGGRKSARKLMCHGCVPINTILPRPQQSRNVNMTLGRSKLPVPIARYKPLQPLRENGTISWNRDGSAARNILYLLLCSRAEITPHPSFIRTA